MKKIFTRRVLAFFLSIVMLTGLVPSVALTANATTVEPVQPEGEGLLDAPYQIATVAELYWFADQVNSGKTDACAKLTQDITINNSVLNSDGELNGNADDFILWTPIGGEDAYYTGTFDGNGHYVKGLYSTGIFYVGMFGYIQGATIKNLTVLDSYFYAEEEYAGGIVAEIDGGTITNCHNRATVKGGYYLGGIAGNNGRGNISKCSNNGLIVGGSYAGGIAGSNAGSGTIENCYNAGSISGANYIGGVVGYNASSSTTKNCYNIGAVTGTSYVGGIVGWVNTNPVVDNCYYLKDSASVGISNMEDSAGVQGKSENDFTSGAVTYLLNNSSSENPVWHQTLTGTDKQSYPDFNGKIVCFDENAEPKYYNADDSAPATYSVTFDTNGGDSINPITVTYGEKYGKLPSSAITGLSGGDSNWYLMDENGVVTETKITRNSVVNTKRNHTLFVNRKVLAPTLKITLEVPGAISDGYQYYVPDNSKRILTVTVNNQNTDILDYTYQWYKDGVAIEDATDTVLTLDGNVADAGTYKVEVIATLKDESGIIVTENTASAEKEQVVKIMHAANTLYYDANGGEGGPSSNYTGGTDITVQTGKPIREGYIFGGWNTKTDGTGENYDGGATYTFANDNGNGGCKVTLYAQWIKAYGVYVSGVQITETNKDDVLGDGSVSYDAETATLTLKDANIINGYEYMEDCVAGIYADGDLNIELIGTENIVAAPASKKASYGIRVLGNLNISGDGAITANGGEVTAQDTTADSTGIFIDGLLYVTKVNVNANGGNAVVIGEGTAYSSGVYSEGGLGVDFEGSLIAKAAKAQGTGAYSHGIEVFGSVDNYTNVSVYDGYLTAEGGEAVGTDYAGSVGIYIVSGGLYLYETKANAEFFSGKAVVTSEDTEKAYAYSNGIYIFAGDVGVEAGKLDVSSGSYVGVNGDAYAVYLQAEELEDDNGTPYSVGGYFTVECDEVKANLYTPNLIGTTVTINSPNGNGIRAESGIDISDKLVISLPENGAVSGVGGSSDPENWSEPDYWIILDSEGAEAQNVIIQPLIYKVYLKGLSYDMAVMVPAGESVNKTYCELFEVDDFSDRLNTNKDGYTFGGWYTDEACTEGNEFSFDDTVSADITIYAKWVSVTADDDTKKDDNKLSGNTSSDITSPQTGDNSNFWLWVALLFVSGGCLFGISFNERKRKEANKR